MCLFNKFLLVDVVGLGVIILGENGVDFNYSELGEILGSIFYG